MSKQQHQTKISSTWPQDYDLGHLHVDRGTIDRPGAHPSQSGVLSRYRRLHGGNSTLVGHHQ